MATSVGDLAINLTTNIASLQTGMNRAAEIAQSTANRMNDAFGTVQRTLAGLGVGLTFGALIAGIKSVIDYADKLNDLSKSTGIAVETLGGLGYAAKQSGVDIETVAKGVQKLAQQMAAAAGGNTELLDLFSRMGVQIKNLDGSLRPLDQTLFDVASKFKSYADGPEKAALATELFKKGGEALIPLLDEGGDKLRALVAEYERYGGVTTETARRADLFNDTLEKIKLIQGALFRDIASALLPSLQAVADVFVDMKSKGEGFSAVGTAIVAAFKIIAIAAVGVVAAFQAVGKAIGGLLAAAILTIEGNYRQAWTALKEGFGDAADAIGTGMDRAAKIFNASAATIPVAVENAAAKTKAPLKAIGTAADDVRLSMEKLLKPFEDFARELGKTGATLAAQLSFLQQYGIELKQTALVTAQYELEQGKLSERLQVVAFLYPQLAEVIRFVTLQLAKQNDETANALELEKQYVEAVRRHVDALAEGIRSITNEISAEQDRADAIGRTRAEFIDLKIAQEESALASLRVIEGADLEVRAAELRIDAYRRLRNETARTDAVQQQFDDLRSLFQTLDSTARSIFDSIGQKGADMWTKIKESGKKILLDFLYSLTLKPFLITIAASLTGVAGNAAANVLGGGGQGNPLSYLLGGANALNVPGFAGGSIQYPAGGGLSGLNNIPTLIGLPSFSTAVGNLGTIIPTFTASMESGAGVIASASTAFAGTAASFATVALPVVGILGLLASSGIFGKSHGPKTQGEFAGTFDQSGALTSTLDSAITGITGDNQSASDARQFAQGLATTFFATLKQLGGTSGALQFGVGFSTDPNGTAQSHVSTVLRDSSGTSILAQNNQNVGRDDASLKAEIALQAQRAVLAALQSSDLPQDIAKILNSVDVATASSDTITKIEAAATIVASFSDSISRLGPQIAALNGDQLVAFVDALGGAQKAVDTFTFINANFTTSAAKAANVQAELVKGFNDLGIAVPKTHDEFLALLGSFDLTTDSGRSLYASVSQLAPLFVQVAGTADQVAEALKKSADAGRDFYGSKFLTPTEQLANRQTIDSTQIYEATKAGTLLNNVLHTLGFETVPTTVESVRSLVTATIAKYGADSKEADALFAIIPIIGDLIDSVGGFGDAATQAADKVSEAASVIVTSVGDIIHQATDLAQTQLSSFSNLAGESTGDFGSKLSIQIDLINAAITNANRADFTSSTAFNTYINTLKASSANLSSELANFTVLSAQYDASRAEQLINLQQWYNEQLKIFGGDKIAAQIASLETLRSQYTRFADAGSATAIAKISDIDKQIATLQASGGPALDALKTIYDQKWAAIVNGASAAAQSLDDFIKSIQQIASNTGGNAGQQASLELALSSAKLADLQQQYSKALPGSALAASIQADIAKLTTYNAGLATQIGHFAIYTAQYGKDVANQLVNLEVEFEGWKASVAGNADALAIVTEIFNDKFKAIIDGIKDGVDQLSKLRVNIADYLKSLFTSNLSPLTPQEQLGQAQSTYVENLLKAQQNDPTALGNFTKFADDYLKQAAFYFGAASQDYRDIFNAVTQQGGDLAGTLPNGLPSVDSLTAIAAALPVGPLAGDSTVKEELAATRALLQRLITDLATANSADSEAEREALQRAADQIGSALSTVALN